MYIDQYACAFPGDTLSPSFELLNGQWVGRLPDHVLSGFREQLNPAQQRQFDRYDRVTAIAAMLAMPFRNSGADLLYLGTARGATQLLESSIQAASSGEQISPYTSPLTTAGCISSEAARLADLPARTLTVSMTCSSALHAIVLAAERLAAGSSDYAIAGGVEAPLTPYVLQQFKSLKLLSRLGLPYPSQPLGLNDENSVVLAEGGALFGLSRERRAPAIELAAWGEGSEKLANPVSYAPQAMRAAMKQAMDRFGKEVDLVLPHAPGTRHGDHQELEAIRSLLGSRVPVLPLKWLSGHSLGASGAVSLALALKLFEGSELRLPFPSLVGSASHRQVESILINASGFGGNAASLVVRKISS